MNEQKKYLIIDRADGMGRCNDFYEAFGHNGYRGEGGCIGSLRKDITDNFVSCDECDKKYPRFFIGFAPFYFDMFELPSGNKKFCPKHDIKNKKGNLTDFSIINCNAGSRNIGPSLVVTTRGATDRYLCSYCFEQFDADCIHGIL